MSTKYSHRKRTLDYSFTIFFDLKTVDNSGKEKYFKCKLSMEGLTPKQEIAVHENIDDIATRFYEVLSDILEVDAAQLHEIEKRRITDERVN